MDIIDILATIPAVIVAISFHEYAHAKVAIKLGDPTPKLQGRDTLNPIQHVDIFGIICLMIAHFGWGKPIQIDPRYFKNPLKGQMLVSLAGPVMNLLIAFVALIIVNIVNITGVLSTLPINVASAVSLMLVYMVLLNISLGIFNLLPLPNFDGLKILLYFVPDKWKFRLLSLEKYGFIIFVLIVLTPIPEYVVTPVLYWVLNGMQFLIDLVLGIFI